MNKKVSGWWIWILIFLFILLIISAIKQFYYYPPLYNDSYENQLQLQQQENYSQESKKETHSLTCSHKYFLNETKCLGKLVKIKYQHSDCSYTWVDWYNCSYECRDGKCIDITSCSMGYLNEKRCSGDWIEQEYQHLNCNTSWIKVKYCVYGCSNEECNPKPQEKIITVSHVFDGDTFKLSTGETIRLIGLNAPESGQSCSLEATAKLKEFVLGKEVTLEQDVSDKDQYDRLLRYVYVDYTFVNLEMVRLGLAHKYEYGSNTKYSAQFEQAENEAKQNEGCLWESEETNYIQDQCIYITNFHFNAAGNDNYNLNDEYITFGNKCSYSIDMTGWTIKDETAFHIYTTSAFTFQPGAMFTLYTGTGINTNSALYWGRTSGDYAAIWNNNGDTLFLRDSNGKLILSQSYSGY